MVIVVSTGRVRGHTRGGGRIRVHSYLRGRPTSESHTATIRTIREALLSGNYAILSASKPGFSSDVNAVRTSRLGDAVAAAGYEAYPADGIYTYFKGSRKGQKTHEASVFVFGMSEETARAYGKQYGQESVLVANRLVQPNGTLLATLNPRAAVFGEAARMREYSTAVNFEGRRVVFSIPNA